ncbi:MAG: hypothetical protein GC180_08265 [Bacteroidetes bacterium]|nr:hypothetical protein [Bacteroidota bacterium]
MTKEKNSGWYAIWRWLLCRCLELFYRRMEVIGLENIPSDKPVIFASNHTNALMDPLVITYFSGKQHYFMTRGDIFKGLMDKIFRSWRMLPLYRMKDGIETLGKNEAVMEFATNRLVSGGSMIIFPEGSHFWIRQVHPLRKGLVRMAYDVLNKDPETELVVIPVGLYYNDMVRINQDVLVNFGEPISVKNFPREENQQRTFLNFNQELREKMKEQLIEIPLEGAAYKQAEAWRIELENRFKSLSLKWSYRYQKEFIAIISQPDFQEQIREMVLSLDEILQIEGLQQWWMGIYPSLYRDNLEYPWLNVLKYPFYWISFLQFLPVFLLGKKILGSIKDSTFHCSVKFGLALLVQPFFALMQAGIAALIFQSWWAFPIYLISMPIWALLFTEWRGKRSVILDPAPLK